MGEPGTHPLRVPVLVLNATYEPINVTGARRAVLLLLKGTAITEEENGALLHAAHFQMHVPSVIRLIEYRKIPHRSRSLSRKNILMRDRHTCQFCGQVFSPLDLTLDHVIPRSRGGRGDWDNLVTRCQACNNYKGNRLPEEAGVTLLRQPQPFTLHISRQLIRLMGQSERKWRKYLFY